MRIVAGFVLIVIGLAVPALFLPAVFDPWSLLAAWVSLGVVGVGVVNVARGAIERGWM